MFTGIVEEIGKVKRLEHNKGFYKIDIECTKILEDVKLGDSISVNGTCLTVDELYEDYFSSHIMGETLEHTNLGSLTNGSYVNLERALRLMDRLGGHIVSGHVDEIGKIVEIKKECDGTWFTISASKHILKYIVRKGSICIDGISLTVAYVDDKVFKVSLIPHTLKNTILFYKKINDSVNLECDLIGKYIEKLIKGKKDNDEITEEKSNITMDFLIKNGF